MMVTSSRMAWKDSMLISHSATGYHHLEEEYQFPAHLVSSNIFWCIPC
uniref:Uncharacterized protein n=1 Tax=Zea mays TaxID=4577 RepID=C0PKC9_MAIZE|nr:unknown [Zea mays]